MVVKLSNTRIEPSITPGVAGGLFPYVTNIHNQIVFAVVMAYNNYKLNHNCDIILLTNQYTLAVAIFIVLELQQPMATADP